ETEDRPCAVLRDLADGCIKTVPSLRRLGIAGRLEEVGVVEKHTGGGPVAPDKRHAVKRAASVETRDRRVEGAVGEPVNDLVGEVLIEICEPAAVVELIEPGALQPNDVRGISLLDGEFDRGVVLVGRVL